MNIVEEIAKYTDTATTNTLGTDMFIGSLADDLDKGILFIGIGGLPDECYDLFEQNIEIWSRDLNSSDGFNKLQEIFTLLHRKQNISTTNAYIYFIQSMTDIESIGRDLNGRALHKIIIRVIYKSDTSIS